MGDISNGNGNGNGIGNGNGNGNGVHHGSNGNGVAHSANNNGHRKSCWYEEEIEQDLRWCFALNSILHTGASQYQDIALLDTKPFGKALVIDGKLQSAEIDEFIYHESLVHPPLLQHSNPKTIFIMGGGEGSTAREILRHKNVGKVIMCDIDEEVVEFCKSHLVANKEAFSDLRLELIINDARAELESRQDGFDVIIGDLADPIEGGPCYQLYTKSFYESIVKTRLNEGGIFVTQAGPAGIFSHTEVFSCIYNTLRQVFKYVVPYSAHIPSYADTWGWVMASDTPFTADAEELDIRMKQRMTGENKYLDGKTFTSASILSKAVRNSLAKETQVYTEGTARVSESDQDQLIENTLNMGSILLEVGKRAQRYRFSKHNSVCWALSHDLTIKVFAMLDTKSLCSAAATCWMFNKCAMNPLCYADIDLTTVVPRVNNAVVATMIHRAGKRLRSLKLGVLTSPTTLSGHSGPMVYGIDSSVDAGLSRNNKRSCQGKDSYILSRSCLTSLSLDGGASGALLKKLHLYNIDKMDNTTLRVALSVCQALTDFEIVGLVTELKQTLESVSTNCPNLECLLIESYKTGRDDSLKSTTCVGFINGCPRLTSLALRGFILQDYKIRILMKGFRKLKFVDLSASYSITGTFLRNLGSGTSGHQLESLILRECMHLKEDISNKEGLASDHDWYDRCYSPSIPVKLVMEERPGLCLVADFPPEGSFMDTEQISESEVNSDANLDLERTGATSESSLSMLSSESSYNSDQGNYLYASSDEVDFLGA
ncbi:hypothetical protein C5167_017295 [Papaver somniferum]|uniref:thermospermine synthase n=1 Tax=Papaver somniferum TaxID=3469 RepID=A0A4Y7IMD0_PAPSO|nr:hypothetical protein C5167_017295 [Papaver somniferum]